jgi:hypothetical protein
LAVSRDSREPTDPPVQHSVAQTESEDREEESYSILREAILVHWPSCVSNADLLPDVSDPLASHAPRPVDPLRLQLRSRYVMFLILRLARIHPVLPVLAILMLGVVIHFLVKTFYSSDIAKGFSSVTALLGNEKKKADVPLVPPTPVTVVGNAQSNDSANIVRSSPSSSNAQSDHKTSPELEHSVIRILIFTPTNHPCWE